jgi:hypothetical protein
MTDEFAAIRARLAPKWARVGEKCGEAEGDLTEFLDF